MEDPTEFLERVATAESAANRRAKEMRERYEKLWAEGPAAVKRFHKEQETSALREAHSDDLTNLLAMLSQRERNDEARAVEMSMADFFGGVMRPSSGAARPSASDGAGSLLQALLRGPGLTVPRQPIPVSVPVPASSSSSSSSSTSSYTDPSRTVIGSFGMSAVLPTAAPVSSSSSLSSRLSAGSLLSSLLPQPRNVPSVSSSSDSLMGVPILGTGASLADPAAMALRRAAATTPTATVTASSSTNASDAAARSAADAAAAAEQEQLDLALALSLAESESSSSSASSSAAVRPPSVTQRQSLLGGDYVVIGDDDDNDGLPSMPASLTSASSAYRPQRGSGSGAAGVPSLLSSGSSYRDARPPLPASVGLGASSAGNAGGNRRQPSFYGVPPSSSASSGPANGSSRSSSNSSAARAPSPSVPIVSGAASAVVAEEEDEEAVFQRQLQEAMRLSEMEHKRGEGESEDSGAGGSSLSSAAAAAPAPAPSRGVSTRVIYPSLPGRASLAAPASSSSSSSYQSMQDRTAHLERAADAVLARANAVSRQPSNPSALTGTGLPSSSLPYSFPTYGSGSRRAGTDSKR